MEPIQRRRRKGCSFTAEEIEENEASQENEKSEENEESDEIPETIPQNYTTKADGKKISRAVMHRSTDHHGPASSNICVRRQHYFCWMVGFLMSHYFKCGKLVSNLTAQLVVPSVCVL